MVMFEFMNWLIIISITLVFVTGIPITFLSFRYENFLYNIFVPEVRKRISNYTPWLYSDKKVVFRRLKAFITGDYSILYGIIGIGNIVNQRNLYSFLTFKFISKKIMEEMLEPSLKLKQIRALNSKEMNILIQKIVSFPISINILGAILTYYFILAILLFLIMFFINFT